MTKPDGPASLPDTFTYGQARAAGRSNRRIYALRDAGEIEQLGRGLFRRASGALFDFGLDYIEALTRAPDATLCLISALAHHGLTDAIPDAYDLALPRGRRHPAVTAVVRWHSFDPDTFTLGREIATVGGTTTMHVYNAPRTIVDAYRMRATLGAEVAHEALRRWLRGRGQPSDALGIARHFPAAMPALRHALEVLLS
jgi:predicted transcriptional regulator of viral defense system